MDSVSRRAPSRALSRVPANVRYPLQHPFVQWAFALAVLSWLLSGSWLVGVACFTLPVMTGIIWRREGPAVLPFALAFQWVFVVAGIFYESVTGRYPAGSWFVPADALESAILLSLLGLLVVAAGMRVGWDVVLADKAGNNENAGAPSAAAGGERYDVRRLFWIVIALYSVNWVVEIFPMRIAFSVAQFIYGLLAAKEILYLALWYAVLRWQSGYAYALAALVFVTVPRLSSTQFALAGGLISLIVVLLSTWRPWATDGETRRRNGRVLLIAGIVVMALASVGVYWEGAVKSVWRWAGVGGTPLQQAQTFVQLSQEAIPQMELAEGVEAFVTRVSSVEQFALVLDRVPAIVPHEGGELTWRAVAHILRPRFLFPDKPGLWDSVLTERYAGLTIASSTSVGIGYIAEFYVDFGVPAMFVPLFLLGLLIAGIYTLLRQVAPSQLLFHAAVTAFFLDTFLTYEANFAKLLGSMAMRTAIFAALLYVVGPWLHRKLQS